MWVFKITPVLIILHKIKMSIQLEINHLWYLKYQKKLLKGISLTNVEKETRIEHNMAEIIEKW